VLLGSLLAGGSGVRHGAALAAGGGASAAAALAAEPSSAAGGGGQASSGEAPVGPEGQSVSREKGSGELGA
jgi:hypothetical protein